MKKAAVLFLLCWCTTLSAQIQGASENQIYAIEAGITNFRPFALNDVIFSPGTGFTQLRTWGFSINTTVVNRGYSTGDANIAFHIFEPRKAEAFNADSSFAASGWELMTSLYGFDLFRGNRGIDLTFAPGVYWGNVRLKIDKHAGNEHRMLYKNPFIAPMVRTDLRFNLGPVTIGGRVSYRYDLTNAKWKRRDDNLNVLPGYRFRELQYIVYIGFRFSE